MKRKLSDIRDFPTGAVLDTTILVVTFVGFGLNIITVFIEGKASGWVGIMLSTVSLAFFTDDTRKAWMTKSAKSRMSGRKA